jgi:sirohydrochlorin cobaltochelatase
MMKKIAFTLLLSILLYSTVFSMSRTIKSDPAIVITAFGTTTEARITFDFFEAQLQKVAKKELEGLKIEWAFTSEIIRERANKKFKQKGINKHYRSLPQVLADLEAEGYRKVVVQPIHIFAGQEYAEVVQTVKAFEYLGLTIHLGNTLTHRWEEMFESLDILSKDFLAPNEGCNVIAIHGSPLTFVGATGSYIGLERYVRSKYSNTYVGAMDGLLTAEQALNQAANCSPKRVRFIPYLFIAGDHIMNDVMSTKTDDEELSWAMQLNHKGLKTETIYTNYNGKQFYKGLGFNNKVTMIFVNSLLKALKKFKKQ